ncbi:Uncharacterised protein [Candidatus Tiddalikarchaeum anstoanum]|nr:Uncharacterised protein [Candidatus Tiddalikarchaeum anstoanum]
MNLEERIFIIKKDELKRNESELLKYITYLLPKSKDTRNKQEVLQSIQNNYEMVKEYAIGEPINLTLQIDQNNKIYFEFSFTIA